MTDRIFAVLTNFHTQERKPRALPAMFLSLADDEAFDHYTAAELLNQSKSIGGSHSPGVSTYERLTHQGIGEPNKQTLLYKFNRARETTPGGSSESLSLSFFLSKLSLSLMLVLVRPPTVKEEVRLINGVPIWEKFRQHCRQLRMQDVTNSITQKLVRPRSFLKYRYIVEITHYSFA